MSIKCNKNKQNINDHDKFVHKQRAHKEGKTQTHSVTIFMLLASLTETLHIVSRSILFSYFSVFFSFASHFYSYTLMERRVLDCF